MLFVAALCALVGNGVLFALLIGNWLEHGLPKSPFEMGMDALLFAGFTSMLVVSIHTIFAAV